MQFGAKSERLPEEQLQLGLESLEQAIAQGEAEAEAEQRDPALKGQHAAKRRASRGALPAHLPRIEVTLEPEATACPCCQGAMAVICHDTSERLDVSDPKRPGHGTLACLHRDHGVAPGLGPAVVIEPEVWFSEPRDGRGRNGRGRAGQRAAA